MDHTFHSGTLRQVLEALETDQETGLRPEEGPVGWRSTARTAWRRPRRRGPPPGAGAAEGPHDPGPAGGGGPVLFAGGGQDWLDAVIILLIVVFNTVISVSQEDNARKALEALRKLSAPKARVIRDGVERRLESTQLVPGDIVLLEAGDYVPADRRILWEAGLQTDESAMTGESLPVHKRGGSGLPEDTPLAERKNMVIGGTVITGGRGRVVVTATGMDTEMGEDRRTPPPPGPGGDPLQRKMGEVSKVLSLVCVGGVRGDVWGGDAPAPGHLDMFLTAVALAVAAIPRGCPPSSPSSWPWGWGEWPGKNAIIKRLPAVETLGCASVICSDKTGTLTKNQMTVLEVWTPVPGRQSQALTLGTLCGDAKGGAWGYVGDPTETAIAQKAREEGLEKARLERDMPRRGEAPLRLGPQAHGHLSRPPPPGMPHCREGGPEAVLARCTQVLGRDGPRTMTEGTGSGS